MKEFNITGLCVPHEHYMVDISGKIDEILKLVHKKRYFTINRARQYGKTTTLHMLQNALSQDEQYLCVSISFEEMSVASFDSESNFCKMFLRKVSDALKFSDADEEYSAQWNNPDVTDIDMLSRHITKMCENKKVVLMIDEVDKSTNNRLFLHLDRKSVV